MDGFIRAIKQNVIVSGLVIVLVLGFLGVVVIPGMTGGTGSTTSTNASVAGVGSQKVEAQDVKTPTPASAVTNATPTVAVKDNTGAPAPVVATPTVVVKASGEYVVKSGDTLSDIAQSNGSTVDAIVSLNGLANVNAISVGQTLKIPGASSGSQAPTVKPTNTPVVNSNETPVSTATARPTNTPGLPTSTSTPKATNTPKPTNTAVPPTATTRPAVDYVVKSIHRLTGCENHGMLRTKIWVLDKNGEPLDWVNVVRYTNTGDFAGSAVTGLLSPTGKGPGMVEFDNAGPGMGGNWHAVIDMPGQTSETAFNLRTDLGAADMPDHMCGDEDGSYFKHISYDVVFQKTS